jgi:hypothetical protein
MGPAIGPQDAHRLWRRCPRPGNTWHLDGVFLTITGERHDCYRAVDPEGHGLDLMGEVFHFEAVRFTLEQCRTPHWRMATVWAARFRICRDWHGSCLVSGGIDS